MHEMQNALRKFPHQIHRIERRLTIQYDFRKEFHSSLYRYKLQQIVQFRSNKITFIVSKLIQRQKQLESQPKANNEQFTKVWLFNSRVDLLRRSKLSIYTVVENTIEIKCFNNIHRC